MAGVQELNAPMVSISSLSRTIRSLMSADEDIDERLRAIPCNYPYVAPDCRRTYAEIIGSPHSDWGIFLLAAGGLGSLLTIVRAPGVIRRGSRFQRACMHFIFIAFLSLLIQGLDIKGYGGTLPAMAAAVATFSTPACLISICLVIAVIWSSLLLSYSANRKRTTAIRLFGWILMVATWAASITFAALLALEPVGKTDVHLYVQLELLTLGGLGAFALLLFIYTGTILHWKVMKSFSETVDNCYAMTDTPPAGATTSYSPAGPAVMMEVESIEPSGKASETQRAAERDLTKKKKESWLSSLRVNDRWHNLPRMTKFLVLFSIPSAAVLAYVGYMAYLTFTMKFLLGWQSYNLCVVSLSEAGESVQRGRCPVVFESMDFQVLESSVLFLCLWGFWKLPPRVATAQPVKDEEKDVVEATKTGEEHLYLEKESEDEKGGVKYLFAGRNTFFTGSNKRQSKSTYLLSLTQRMSSLRHSWMSADSLFDLENSEDEDDEADSEDGEGTRSARLMGLTYSLEGSIISV